MFRIDSTVHSFVTDGM